MVENRGKILELNPLDTVMIVVDVQNDRHKPGGMSYEQMNDKEHLETKSYILRLQRLLQRCREEKMRIVHSQSIRAADDPWFRVFGTHQRLLEGTWGVEIIDKVKPLPHERVVQKRCLDCFANTNMEAVLEEMNVIPTKDTVIVTGGANSSCAYHAIMGFTARHYEVVVPLDCIYGAAEGERFMIDQLSSPEYSFNTVLTRSELIAFKQLHPSRKIAG